jgi:nucleotide-binding universal stress UspA family protein
MATATPSAHWEKLLVCTDGSPDSEGAITAAQELAKAGGSTIYLLDVLTYIPYELQSPDLLPSPAVNLDLQAVQEQAVRERLETWKARAAEAGVALEPRVRTSNSPFDGIMEEIAELKPDLVLMGRHGFSGLTRLLMGSVTARVIGHSPVNVLVVPKDVPLGFKRILMASDDSPFSAAAFQEALSITLRMGSTLMGIAVAQSDADAKTAHDVAHKMADEAQRRGVALETAVPFGPAFESIVRVAKAKQTNLIILGSHGRTGLKRLLMGSTAERVIGQAPCAVLVVKKVIEVSR